MSIKFNEPTQKSAAINIKPIETSYETIWAALRIAPKKAYLELLDQPDKITPYTAKPEIAKINKRLILTSAKKQYDPKGKIDQLSKLIKNVSMGAKMKLNVFAFVGITASLTKSFKPSAKGCNNPKKPTEFGPKRCCIAPIIFRSANVK